MDAVGELENLVKKYNIPKEMIHVEVTESALTDNFSLLNEATTRIKELGYSRWILYITRRINLDKFRFVEPITRYVCTFLP